MEAGYGVLFETPGAPGMDVVWISSGSCSEADGNEDQKEDAEEDTVDDEGKG